MSGQALATLLGYPAQVLADLLPALAEFEDSRDLGYTRAISVDRVVACAWDEGRLARAASSLAAGEKAPPIRVSRYWILSVSHHRDGDREKAPPIRVSRYWIRGEALYTVADGMHRTIAARQAGCKRITAVISSESECHPERYMLERSTGSLWREVPPDKRLITLVQWDIGPEVAAALVAVGVREFER